MRSKEQMDSLINDTQFQTALLLASVVFTIFCLVMYAAFKIGDIDEIKNSVRKNFYKLILILLFVPFLGWFIIQFILKLRT